MNRYYLSADQWNGKVLTITGDEAQHCARVMRAKVGDEIEVFDGEGRSAVCQIQSISRSAVTAHFSNQKYAKHISVHFFHRYACDNFRFPVLIIRSPVKD